MVRIAVRYAIMILGFFVIAIGIVMTVQAGMGPAPWDVLHVGISRTTGIPLGRIIVYTGLVVIIVGLSIRVRPTLCTILNMLLIGTFVDLISAAARIETPEAAIGRLALLAAGIVISGLGEGIYLGTGAGAGPRDGFMLGLVRLTRKRIWLVQTVIEVTVVLAGYLLGSPPGVGTVIFALTIGYFVETFLRILTPFISRFTGRARGPADSPVPL